MDRKVAVVLSGCGYLDGAEITESVSTLIALSEEGAKVRIFAPKIQVVEVNHLTGEDLDTKRDVFQESARIARGKIEDIEKLDESEFDAIVFPGGFGAAKTLSDFAFKGAKGKTLPVIEKLINSFHQASKPIGVFCIAPAMLSLVLGKEGVAVTIGNDQVTASEINKTGADHIECKVDDYVTDRENKLISSPAYMYDSEPHLVHKGIRSAIRELMEMA